MRPRSRTGVRAPAACSFPGRATAALRGSVRAAAFLLLAAGCRDGAALFEAEDLPPAADGALVRLTYNIADDRAPVWSAGGDSVYYSAAPALAPARPIGVLNAVPARGGTARPLLGAIQDPTAPRRWLTAPAPAPAPDGRLAYVEVWGRLLTDLCLEAGAFGIVTNCENFDWVSLLPRLTEVRVRVRQPDAIGPVEDDPELRVEIDHFHFDETRHPLDLPGVMVYRDHPFHRLYREDGTLFFRPSWAPGGDRLVVGDGLRLLVWSVGATEAAPIPGTDDGVTPAWSPDGQWIAFTRVERADSLFNRCVQYALGNLACMVEQHLYLPGERTLLLVRPDGSELRRLTVGEEPAWAPDGRTLYFRSVEQIWSIDVEGGELRPIAGTMGGREPAVSPDGRHLAFTRSAAGGTRDVWVLALP